MSGRSALGAATIGAVTAYTVAALAPSLPSLFFFPRLGTWSVMDIAGEPSIRWYGWLIYGILGGVLGLAGGRVFQKRPPWFLVWSICVTAVLLLSWHERPWFLM